MGYRKRVFKQLNAKALGGVISALFVVPCSIIIVLFVLSI